MHTRRGCVIPSPREPSDDPTLSRSMSTPPMLAATGVSSRSPSTAPGVRVTETGTAVPSTSKEPPRVAFGAANSTVSTGSSESASRAVNCSWSMRMVPSAPSRSPPRSGTPVAVTSAAPVMPCSVTASVDSRRVSRRPARSCGRRIPSVSTSSCWSAGRSSCSMTIERTTPGSTARATSSAATTRAASTTTTMRTTHGHRRRRRTAPLRPSAGSGTTSVGCSSEGFGYGRVELSSLMALPTCARARRRRAGRVRCGRPGRRHRSATGACGARPPPGRRSAG